MEYLQRKEELEIGPTNTMGGNWEDSSADNTVLYNDSGKKGIRKMYFVSVAILFHAVITGYAGAYSSTATDDMTRKNSRVRPNSDEIGWIGSLIILGSLIGGLAAGPISDYAGRKGTLLLSTIPHTVGWLLIAYATSLPYIYSGRIIIGICCSFAIVNGPMYLIEISTPEIRGLLGASFQLFVTLGVLLVSCIGAYVPWAWSALAASIITVITFAATIFIPESPRWLMAKGRKDEALWTIKYLQGNFVDPNEEIRAIQQDIDNQPKGEIKFKELKSPEVYKPALLSFVLLCLQQGCGFSVVLFYTVAIFKNASKALKPTTAAIIVNSVQVVVTLICSVLIDKAGRKILLFLSAAIMAVSLFGFGGFDFAVQKDNTASLQTTYGWIPILCIVIFLSSFSIGFGPIPWIMVSEMTNVRFRSLTAGVAAVLNFIVGFILTKTVHQMEDTIHTYGTYWTYASLCVLSCLFVYFYLPETKGKPIEEVQKYFISNSDEISSMKSIEAIT